MCLHCYIVYMKIDAGTKVKTARTWLCCQRPCALVVSADVPKGTRHNGNYVCYAQMPGCPLCSIYKECRLRGLSVTIDYVFRVCAIHGGIRYGALRSQRSHSNAYAVLSPLAATLLMAPTQSIIVTCTGFHAFGTRSRVDPYGGGERNSTL